MTIKHTLEPRARDFVEKGATLDQGADRLQGIVDAFRRGEIPILFVYPSGTGHPLVLVQMQGDPKPATASNLADAVEAAHTTAQMILVHCDLETGE